MSSLDLGNYNQFRWQYERYYKWFSSRSKSAYAYMDDSDLFGHTNTEVDFERHELQEVMIKYITIRDCLLGEANIKDKGEIYLPRPSDDIKEVEDDLRYQHYIRRATFLNATGLTQRTIVGKLFSKPPTIDLPPRLEILRSNINGEGLAFGQMIEQALSETFAFGRCGLYADFRSVEQGGELSVADSENLAPTITFVKPENIINWRLDKTRKRVIMVVIREFYETYQGFSVKKLPQYRVFKLSEDNVLSIDIYRSTNRYANESPSELGDNRQRYYRFDSYVPLLPNGETWDRIPFSIIGSTDNDWTIDEPPLYQIATYDLSLYRNSADIEEAAFYVGQPTPYVAGIDREWADDMEIRNVKMGSGRFIPLEHSDSKLGLVQASPETMLDTIIDYKMSILRHLGATVFSTEKLAEDQTATGAIYQALQIHAPLVTTSRNVVEAFNKVVGFAAMYVGIDPESVEIEIKLNSDILDNPLGITGLQMTQELYLNRLITYDEAREQVRVQGLAQHTAEEARKIIDSDPPPLRSSQQRSQRPQNDNATNFQQQSEVNDE